MKDRTAATEERGKEELAKVAKREHRAAEGSNVLWKRRWLSGGVEVGEFAQGSNPPIVRSSGSKWHVWQHPDRLGDRSRVSVQQLPLRARYFFVREAGPALCATPCSAASLASAALGARRSAPHRHPTPVGSMKNVPGWGGRGARLQLGTAELEH